MKILLTLFGGLLALVLLGIVAVIASAQLSLDRDFNHTRTTASLPPYSATANDELVRISANGVEFRARVAGLKNDGETIILLHGFPVTSAMWQPVIAPLAAAGYRVIAFDQRGYSPGARPNDASEYRIANLVSDVIAVADRVGAEKFHLVGHDWGSAVGWSTVLAHPARIISWTGISIAHPVAFGEALQNDPDQQSRSGYFALFVTPLLPETLFTFNNLALLQGAYQSMTTAQQQEYVRVFSEPGALTAALNWYRQMGAGPGAGFDSPNVDIPTLFIWGNNDAAVGRSGVEAQAKFMTGPYREIELDGDHWLLETHGDEIVAAMLDHMGQSGGLQQDVVSDGQVE